jgi:hypothetical protein
VLVMTPNVGVRSVSPGWLQIGWVADVEDFDAQLGVGRAADRDALVGRGIDADDARPRRRTKTG